MDSRAAAIFLFLTFFFGLVGNIVHFFAKIKNKVPSRPVLTHPAAGPETEVFAVWPSGESLSLLSVEKAQSNFTLSYKKYSIGYVMLMIDFLNRCTEGFFFNLTYILA